MCACLCATPAQAVQPHRAGAFGAPDVRHGAGRGSVGVLGQAVRPAACGRRRARLPPLRGRQALALALAQQRRLRSRWRRLLSCGLCGAALAGRGGGARGGRRRGAGAGLLLPAREWGARGPCGWHMWVAVSPRACAAGTAQGARWPACVALGPVAGRGRGGRRAGGPQAHCLSRGAGGEGMWRQGQGPLQPGCQQDARGVSAHPHSRPPTRPRVPAPPLPEA
jgi:hypothetical protein